MDPGYHDQFAGVLDLHVPGSYLRLSQERRGKIKENKKVVGNDKNVDLNISFDYGYIRT